MSNLLATIRSRTAGKMITSQIFVTAGDKLLIGPYRKLKNLSSQARQDSSIQHLLLEIDARFGRRFNDYVPTGPVQVEGFRSKIKDWEPVADRRVTEQFTRNDFNPVKEYYNNATLEAHHIVEDNLLEKCSNKNTGDLLHDIAPCVLIKRELHNRLYTVQGSHFRNTNDITLTNLCEFYLQSSETKYSYHDLHTAAQVILDSLK